MPAPLSAADQVLWQRLDEVLHYIWDPIGISGIPQARGEYEDQVPALFALLQSGADAAQVASALTALATGTMGQEEDHEHALHVAEILVDWRAAVRDASAH